MSGGIGRLHLSWALAGARLSSTLDDIQAHLRTPLVRNGYSLVASTGMTSVLGLVYWVLAARLYSVGEIGLNAALVSTMMALGSIAQLNLSSVLTRFLPGIERSACQRMILGAYAAGMLVALVSCVGFLLGLHAWAPSLRLLADSPWLAAWFTASTMIWAVFSLQDGVLAGLRKAIWVPIENTLFALAKIVLLLILVDSAWRAWGPFASWTIPLLAALPPVNVLIFRRLLPARGVTAAQRTATVDMRWFLRYFASDFLGTLFFMAAVGLAPILVVEKAGAADNAVYYLSWTIAYSLYLVSKSMGVSLVAEGAADPWRSKTLAAGALAHTMGLLVIAVAIVVVAAPLILSLFGPAYAEGSALLRILSLSAIPFGFTSMFLGLARLEGRMAAVILVQAMLMVLVLGLSVPLMDALGTLGMGIAWLVAQTVIALALGIVAWRSDRGSHRPLHAFFGGPSNGGRFLSGRALMDLLPNRRLAALVREATSRIEDDAGSRPWRCRRLLRLNRQFDVLMLGSDHGEGTALMKVARKADGIAALRHQNEVLHTLKADPGLREFCRLLPSVLVEHHAADSAYVVERPAAGEPGNVMLADGRRRERSLASAAQVIAALHDRTAATSEIDEAWLSDWVDGPIEAVLESARFAASADGAAASLEAIRSSQRAAWGGRILPLGWSHGSFSPMNIRFSEDGTCVTGIVGWERARRNAPAALDLCRLVLTARAMGGRAIGDVVCGLLREPCWDDCERRCFEQQSIALTESDIRALVLLAWLQHVAEEHAKSGRPAADSLWTACKIDRILRSLGSVP